MGNRMGKLEQIHFNVTNSITILPHTTTVRIDESVERNRRDLESIRKRMGEVEGQLEQGLKEMREEVSNVCQKQEEMAKVIETVGHKTTDTIKVLSEGNKER